MEEEKLGNNPVNILFVGATLTGKTSLIRRYMDNEFSHNNMITVGVDRHKLW